ncbi:hypothetical protein AMK16_26785 [Streptomyces sp. CB00455]|nr:hypothetical protein AMK16_26785 [Streptomyces sp. CB00455]
MSSRPLSLPEPSASLVESSGQAAVGGSGCVEFGLPFFQRARQLDVALFEPGDAAGEFRDVGGRPESGGLPDLLAEGFRQAFFELMDAGGQAGAARARVGQVGLQGSGGDGQPGPGLRCGFVGGGVEGVEEVAVAIEEGAVDAGRCGRWPRRSARSRRAGPR